jgi:hypothetical protein
MAEWSYGKGLYQPQDVNALMEQYQSSAQPYYAAAAGTLRQQIEKQIRAAQQNLGQSFEDRGLYGRGMYPRAAERLYGSGMASLGEAQGQLSQQQMLEAIRRRTQLTDEERRRQYEAWLQQIDRLYQERQAGRGMWGEALGGLFGAAGTVAGAYVGGKK